MINLKQNLYFLAFLTIIFTLACKKNKPADEGISGKGDVPAKPIDKTFLPIKFESNGFVLTIKYLENTALLTEVQSSDGNKSIISYTKQQQLLKVEKYKNDKLFYSIDYIKDNREIINKAILFNYTELSHNYTPLGYYTLAYNDQNQITGIKTYNNNSTDNLINENTRSYRSSGNLSSVLTMSYPGTSNSLDYTYDDKKGIARYIAYSPLLSLEFENYFLMCSVNNILNYSNQKAPLENTNFSYEYNKEGYPSKMIITKNKNTQSFNITYKELTQE